MWGYQVAGESNVKIRCDRCTEKNISIYWHEELLKLPPPPFSDSRRPLPNPSSGAKTTSPLIDKEIEIQLSRGWCFLSQDVNEKEGVTLHARDIFFPDVMSVDMMVQSMRYITSRAEFESLLSSKNKREEMERIWTDIAGDKKKARELIRIYYNRVREANIYFSNLAPGWKTDRGLIHIIFGNPKKIFLYADSEVWLYGEEDNLNSLKFTFREIPSPFPGKHLVLNRDHVYKTNWDRAVTSWRNGRIYSE